MREIDVKLISDTVKELCIQSNIYISQDIKNAVSKAKAAETSSPASEIYEIMLKNYECAECSMMPVCQDTGMAVVFLKIGQDVHLTGGSLKEAVNEGVRQGYAEGYLRMSVVEDPLIRKNTGDNTPAVLYTEIVEGESITVTVAPKGFGSENMSRIKMFNPSSDGEEIIEFVVQCVKEAGSNPCPPVILGIGIGGTFEKAALLSKEALLLPLDYENPNPLYKKMEREILERVNALEIGPQGFGGSCTALSAKIKTYPTHIAGLPVAVNMGCHITRHAEKIL